MSNEPGKAPAKPLETHKPHGQSGGHAQPHPTGKGNTGSNVEAND